MKTISLCSWKGGTGKTSLTTAIVENLAKRGNNILVIDLDSNLSITSIYNSIQSSCYYNSVELLNGNLNFEIPVIKGKRISIIPSDLKIARLNNISDRVLKVNLSKMDLSVFDYVFIDPPGTMNALCRNAIVASDKVIVTSMFSEVEYQATKLIMEEMEMLGVDSDISIVLNRFDQKRSPEYIEKWFRENESLSPFMWSGKIPAMRSISRLTSEVNQGYELKGKAKQIIDTLIEEVVL